MMPGMTAEFIKDSSRIIIPFRKPAFEKDDSSNRDKDATIQ
jgi:hypothetical protein